MNQTGGGVNNIIFGGAAPSNFKHPKQFIKRRKSANRQNRNQKHSSVHVKSRSETYQKMLLETDKKLTAHEMEQIPVEEMIQYRSNLLNNKITRALAPST